MTTKKHAKFVSESIAGKSVSDVPGIGATYSKRLQSKGISTASQLYNQYQSFGGDREQFKSWLQSNTAANDKYSEDCYNAMRSLGASSTIGTAKYSSNYENFSNTHFIRETTRDSNNVENYFGQQIRQVREPFISAIASSSRCNSVINTSVGSPSQKASEAANMRELREEVRDLKDKMQKIAQQQSRDLTYATELQDLKRSNLELQSRFDNLTDIVLQATQHSTHQETLQLESDVKWLKNNQSFILENVAKLKEQQHKVGNSLQNELAKFKQEMDKLKTEHQKIASAISELKEEQHNLCKIPQSELSKFKQDIDIMKAEQQKIGSVASELKAEQLNLSQSEFSKFKQEMDILKAEQQKIALVVSELRAERSYIFEEQQKEIFKLQLELKALKDKQGSETKLTSEIKQYFNAQQNLLDHTKETIFPALSSKSLQSREDVTQQFSQLQTDGRRVKVEQSESKKWIANYNNVYDNSQNLSQSRDVVPALELSNDVKVSCYNYLPTTTKQLEQYEPKWQVNVKQIELQLSSKEICDFLKDVKGTTQQLFS